MLSVLNYEINYEIDVWIIYILFIYSLIIMKFFKKQSNKSRIVNHQVRKGSILGFISTAELLLPESGYSSKFDTSPKLFTTGT